METRLAKSKKGPPEAEKATARKAAKKKKKPRKTGTAGSGSDKVSSSSNNELHADRQLGDEDDKSGGDTLDDGSTATPLSGLLVTPVTSKDSTQPPLNTAQQSNQTRAAQERPTDLLKKKQPTTRRPLGFSIQPGVKFGYHSNNLKPPRRPNAQKNNNNVNRHPPSGALQNNLTRTTIIERPTFNESLRWEYELSDSKEEEERIRVYKMNRRKRYLAAQNDALPVSHNSTGSVGSTSSLSLSPPPNGNQGGSDVTSLLELTS